MRGRVQRQQQQRKAFFFCCTSKAKVWKWPLTSRPMASSCSSAGGAWPDEAPVSAYQCSSSAGAAPCSSKLSQNGMVVLLLFEGMYHIWWQRCRRGRQRTTPARRVLKSRASLALCVGRKCGVLRWRMEWVCTCFYRVDGLWCGGRVQGLDEVCFAMAHAFSHFCTHGPFLPTVNQSRGEQERPRRKSH